MGIVTRTIETTAPRRTARRQRVLGALLAASIAVLTVAAPSLAAQPGPLRGANPIPAEAGATTGESAAPPSPRDADPVADAATSEGASPARSTRPRLRSAPLPRPSDEDAAPGGDDASTVEREPDGLPSAERLPGDDERGRDRPTADGRGGEGDRDRERDTPADEEPSGERVWPLRPEDFDFTQAFGCVPQLGGFYRPTPGCPNEAPGFHTGIDLGAPQGTRFYAAASGRVLQAGLDREVGLANTRIVVQHDGPNDDYATEYLHWITAYVEPGDYVRAGQPLGEVGSVGYSTGPHLHFSVIDFDSGEHVDPTSWLPRDRATGSYLGLAPGSREITFDDAPTRRVPDYADPAPPPLPRRERLPDPPAGAVTPDRSNRDADDRDAQDGGGDSRAADPDRREPRDDRERAARDDRRADQTAEEARPDQQTPDDTTAADGNGDAARKERADRDGEAADDGTAGTDQGSADTTDQDPAGDADAGNVDDVPSDDGSDRDRNARRNDKPDGNGRESSNSPSAPERGADRRAEEPAPADGDQDGEASKQGGGKDGTDDGNRNPTEADRPTDAEQPAAGDQATKRERGN